MDRSEIGNLFDRIGQMFERSAPVEAEYWRGYYEGIKFYYRGGMVTVRDHYNLRKIADWILTMIRGTASLRFPFNFL